MTREQYKSLQLVQLKEINDPNLITSQYLPLDGMDQEGGAQVLVNALEVTPSGRWLNPTNHLLEKDFAVKLKAGTRMLDVPGISWWNEETLPEELVKKYYKPQANE